MSDQSIDVYLGRIPVMVGSELCHTHGLTQKERYERGEPEKDPQGYFVMKGAEKVLLNIEKLRTSAPYLYENKGKYMVRYTSQTLTDTTVNVISEDRYDIQASFTKLGLTTNSINIFYLFYVLGLGNNTVSQIYNFIDYYIVDDNPERQARRRKDMRFYLQTTEHTYLAQTGNNQERVLNILAGKFRDPNILNDINRNTLLITSVRTELFKNIPYSDQWPLEDQISAIYAKIRLLASMVAKFIDFKNGYRDVDDRDAWGNKQLTDAGKHLSTRFVQIWKSMIESIQNKVTSNGLTTAQQIKRHISQNSMSDQFINSFSKELWGATRGTREVVVVDTLKRDNIVAAWAHVRRITTPTIRRAQIREKRLIHNTQWGVACPVTTPEGEACFHQFERVTLATGEEIMLIDLKDGDEVLTIDPITLQQTTSKIYNHFVKSSEEYGIDVVKVIAGERSLICTGDHQFLTNKGWIRADNLDLMMHEVFIHERGQVKSIKIDSIEPHPPCLVGDFTTVSENHSMISNGFVTHNCGLVKDSAVTIYISLERDQAILRSHLDGRYSTTPEEEKKNALYLNGIPLGFCDAPALRRYLLELRRTRQQIPFDTGIVLDQYGELWINTTDSRVCRPLLLVDPASQELLIDKKDLRGADLNTLLSEGVMEYIDVAEQEQPQILIAETVKQLRQRREENRETIKVNERILADSDSTQTEIDNAQTAIREVRKRMAFTHCEVDPTAILGISAVLTPFAEFNPGPRMTYQAGMIKQGLGANSSRVELRYDTTIRTMVEPGVPTISTDAHEWIGLDDYPQGQEVILAITTYGGQNQEDAIIYNKDAVDRGMFNMMIFHGYSEVVCQSKGRQEKVMVPENIPESQRPKYSHLDQTTGIVRVGETVTTGDALVGKVAINSATGQVKNETLFVEVGKRGVIDEVYVTENAESCKLIRIRIREFRKIQTGDKFASRYSQKGTIGSILPGRQMPWITSDNPVLNGVRPHIIFNPHGIPSRMTIGKLFEMLMGILTGVTGERYNATAFRRYNYREYQDQLEALGFSRNGKSKMVNGITGREMDVDIFVGPVYYQLLRHLVQDKMQARGTGAVQFLTRQPTSGIRKEGGLRLGEMERDVLIEYGAAYLTQERMSISSDVWQGVVCSECGQFAIKNVERGDFRCRMCPQGEFVRVKVPYSLKLMSQILAAANIKLSLRTQDV
jgi:DNA-directed RNA polymerase beta subunit